MRPCVEDASMKKLLSLLLLLGSLLIHSQNIGIGEWRSHQSYNQAKHLVRANNTLFCATEFGFFSVDLTDNSVSKFTREEGLGSAGISALHFSEEQQLIVIGYSDGIIDLVNSNGEVTTIKTLRDASIVAEKDIHDITSFGNFAFLATDFGVVVLDLVNKVVKENFRNIGPGATEIQVQDLLATSESLYIVTDQGIQSGSFEDNLLDFNEWYFYPETDSNFEILTESEDQIYCLRNQTELWELESGTWQNTGTSFPEPINAFANSDELFAVSSTSIYTVFPNPFAILSPELLVSGHDLVKFNDEFWIADHENGLLVVDSSTEQIIPTGPITDYPSRIKWVNGKTYSLFGPNPEAYNGSVDGLGYSYFENALWQTAEIPNFSNISDVSAIVNQLYFTSMGFGLYDVEADQILNQENSDFISGSFGGVQLSAIQSSDNSLFISSYGTSQALYKWVDGQLTPFTSSEINSQHPVDIDISREGVIWLERGTSDGGGIAVFDYESMESRVIRTSDGLPSSDVTGISIDFEDEAWISTARGPASYSGASFPFNEFGVTTPIFDNGFLFQDEEINDILTDGGDRIWFATNRGVWVLSRDLSEIIHEFNTDNSPLLSNVVLQFAYDQLTGEVFILTDKGLISFRSDSSVGLEQHASSVKIFPNPVLPSFSGKVGIAGLVRNAEIKITDSKGRLVRSLMANGGTAEWDISNHSGDRVDTGIYLVFSSNSDGTETAVGKIAVIR